jgi:hypothetical protein
MIDEDDASHSCHEHVSTITMFENEETVDSNEEKEKEEHLEHTAPPPNPNTSNDKEMSTEAHSFITIPLETIHDPQASILKCLKELSYAKTVKDLCTQPRKSRHHRPKKILRVSILASFCVWTKSLKCKDTVNSDSTIQSLQVRRNSSSLSVVWTIEPSRPNAHLSIVSSVRTTCHPIRTLDRPASSVQTKCSFRPDPILYREVSVPACIRPDVSAACTDASQYSISF